jgi:hypothetical protein
MATILIGDFLRGVAQSSALKSSIENGNIVVAPVNSIKLVIPSTFSAENGSFSVEVGEKSGMTQKFDCDAEPPYVRSYLNDILKRLQSQNALQEAQA